MCRISHTRKFLAPIFMRSIVVLIVFYPDLHNTRVARADHLYIITLQFVVGCTAMTSTMTVLHLLKTTRDKTPVSTNTYTQIVLCIYDTYIRRVQCKMLAPRFTSTMRHANFDRCKS